MTKFGLLYEKLIVDTRATHSTYYHHVQKVIEEMKEDYPDMDADIYWNGPTAIKIRQYDDDLFHEDLATWFEKWFGDSSISVPSFLFSSPDYRSIYPNEDIPPKPKMICGDMMAELIRCSRCGKLFWNAEFGRDVCGACGRNE